jgi:hypothetical protein
MRHAKSWLIALLGSAALLGALLLRGPIDPAPADRARAETSAAATPAPLAIPAAETAPSAPTATGTSSARPAAAQAVEVDRNPHPGSRLDEAAIRARHGDEPLTATHPAMASAIEIQERNNDWLLRHPAVVGTGIGLNDDAQIALIVYTKADAPDLPKAIEGLPVAPYLSGEFVSYARPQEAAPRAKPGPGAAPSVNPASRFPRPVPIGVSTGHFAITAGTIGCRVKNDTQIFALSNNHVYANSNDASVGDASLQPGPYDGGTANDTIGTLYDFEPIVFHGDPTAPDVPTNAMDAAVSLSHASNLGTATPSNGYGTPKTTTATASINLGVMKYGRTTGQTTGKVWSINGTSTVNYGVDAAGAPLYARFVKQIIIYKSGFSAGGDSGSLIVTNARNDVRRPLGLLFAGGTSTTIANPIGPVLSRFGVTIDGQ